MTDAEEIADGAETPKYRALVEPYLKGCGLDIGTGGYRPVVPNAICVEQDEAAFAKYTSNRVPQWPIHLRCDARHLPFTGNALDFIYCGHVIEDWSRELVWPTLFKDWIGILKPGGYLVLLVPDCLRWNEAIKRGQAPNCAHFSPEPSIFDMSKVAVVAGFRVIEERLTNLTPEDYTIMGVFQKP